MRLPVLHACIRSAVLAVICSGEACTVMGGPGPHPSWVSDPWRTNDGLPNNDVTGTVQAKDGALVIATHGGVVRFDGLRFRRLELDTGGKGGPAVSALCLGRSRSLWFIHQGEVVKWKDGKTELSIPMPDLGARNRVSSMFATPDDTVWIGMEKRELFRVEGGVIATVKTEAGLEPDFSSTVTMDAKGAIWAAGPGVLARWNGTQLVKVAELPRARIVMTAARDGGVWLGAGLSLLRFKEKEGIAQIATLETSRHLARISSMVEDSGGRVWCGTFAGGLHCWHGGRFEEVDAGHHDVFAIMEDAERNLWVSTAGGGVVRVRQRVMKLFDEPDGPMHQTARSLCVDSMNQVWVVLQSGDVEVRKRDGWQRVPLSSDLKTAGVICAAADDKGTVWLACAENKLARWDGTTFHQHGMPVRKDEGRVHAMFVARDGRLWIGRGGQLIHGLPGNWKSFASAQGRGDIVTIEQDRAGTIWAGTTSGKLLRVEGPTMKIMVLDADSGGIRCLMASPDGALWIGRDQGLARLKEARYVRLSRSRVASPAVSQITLDEQNRVWLGVDQGALVAELEDLNRAADGRDSTVNYSNYTTSGYQASTGWSPNVALAPGGWLWFCTRSGIVIANTHASGANTMPPSVSIEAVTVNGKPMPQTPSLRFGPRPQEVQFELGAMSYRLPEQVRVYHRIDKVDPGWMLAGKDRIARYPRLPAGAHTLRVRAVNEDGVVSEKEATLAFKVVPAFWQTPLFRMGIIALAAIVMFFAARALVLRKLRRETEALREQVAVNGERVRIARDMHDQLGASLTQISLITDLMVAEGAEDKRVAQLARTARQASTALDEIVWAVNPRHDHLGSVLEYLGQQAVNLVEPAGLRCRLDLPNDATDRHLPAEFRHQLFLIVREAINNVIKHASAKEVSFSAKVTPEGLSFTIADDGRGGVSPAGGEGLHNMRSRAEVLGGECHIHSATGEGTTVDVRVPWPQRPRSS